MSAKKKAAPKSKVATGKAKLTMKPQREDSTFSVLFPKAQTAVAQTPPKVDPMGQRVVKHMAQHGLDPADAWSAMNAGGVCGHCGERV